MTTIEKIATIENALKEAEKVQSELKKQLRELEKERGKELLEIAKIYAELINGLIEEAKNLGIGANVYVRSCKYAYELDKCCEHYYEETGSTKLVFCN